jgi:hypothetical protein
MHVDDIILFSNNPKIISEVENILHSDFECADLDTAHYILGIGIEYSPQGILLNQTLYINKILERFSILDYNLVGIPLDASVQLQKRQLEDKIDDPIFYQSIIGSLMYACISTRPDLAHAVTLLSQFSSCLPDTYLAIAKRVLRYLKGIQDWELHYPRKNDGILHRFSDSSYGNFLDRKNHVLDTFFR